MKSVIYLPALLIHWNQEPGMGEVLSRITEMSKNVNLFFSGCNIRAFLVLH